jgi:hypothetical protein
MIPHQNDMVVTSTASFPMQSNAWGSLHTFLGVVVGSVI